MVAEREEVEVHPPILVTVNVYVPSARLGIVTVAVFPVVSFAPGDRVTFQLEQGAVLLGRSPGKPFKTTDPVPPQVVALVMRPIVGGDWEGVTQTPPLHLPVGAEALMVEGSVAAL